MSTGRVDVEWIQFLKTTIFGQSNQGIETENIDNLNLYKTTELIGEPPYLKLKCFPCIGYQYLKGSSIYT